MAKRTMQDIADAAGVSRITVWKALNNRPGVSAEMRQAIRQQAAEMGYGAPGSEAPPAAERTFSVVVARPESSAFWMQIIHHMAKELSAYHGNLMYTYMPSAYTAGYQLPASLSRGEVDGLIVLNVYDAQLLHLLNAQPLPKVFLDTVPDLQPPALKGDLVIIEGRSRVREITARLIDTGRTRLGFVGDVRYAQTNLDRFQGFADALTAGGIPIDPALCMTGPISLRRHYEEISQFLDGLAELPQAMVCASDFIAHFVSRYLSESGRPTPSGFLLTGFDNNIEYANVAQRITTVHVETSALGKRLARKLLFRADYPGAPWEVSYAATDILYRGPLA